MACANAVSGKGAARLGLRMTAAKAAAAVASAVLCACLFCAGAASALTAASPLLPPTKAAACLVGTASVSAASAQHGTLALEAASSEIALLEDDGAIAAIGDVEYASVAAAFEAAQEGDTVVLLADTFEAVAAPAVAVTLDLNGHVVKGNLSACNGATLTLVSSVEVDAGVVQVTFAVSSGSVDKSLLTDLRFVSGTSTYDPSSWVDLDTSHSLAKAYAEGSSRVYYVVGPHRDFKEVPAVCGDGSYYKCGVAGCTVVFADPEGAVRTSVANYNHNLSQVAAKAATCTEDGNIAYWRCSKCGKLFSDAQGKVETTEEAVTLYARGHQKHEVPAAEATCTEDGSTGYWTCTLCGGYYTDSTFSEAIEEADAVVPALGHEWGEWETVSEPTCTAEGSQKRVCARCGGEETEEIAKLAHVMTKIEYVAATCVGTGHGEYYHCSTCDKYYKDEAGTTETTPDKEELSTIGHSYTWYAAKAATCTERGNAAYGKCRMCGNYVLVNSDGTRSETTEDKVFTDALGHSVEAVEAKDATCTEAGSEAAYKCSRCGLYFEDEAAIEEVASEDVVIAALGHDLVKTEAKAATTSSTGNSAYYTCSRCGKIFAEDGTTETTLEAVTIAKLSSGSTGSSGSSASASTLSSSSTSSSSAKTSSSAASATSSTTPSTTSAAASTGALADSYDFEEAVANDAAPAAEDSALNGFLVGFLVAMGLLAALIAAAAVLLRRGDFALPSVGRKYIASRSAALAAQERAEGGSSEKAHGSRFAFSFLPSGVAGGGPTA